ncbi:MAG TPA: hypothetical protein ENJ86_13470 [Methylothermaceae bacterium]|nr:hypothetical protein [Methylothermaceae bacterium]
MKVVDEKAAVTDDVFERFYLPPLSKPHQISGEALSSNLQRVITLQRPRKEVILSPVAGPSVVDERRDR